MSVRNSLTAGAKRRRTTPYPIVLLIPRESMAGPNEPILTVETRLHSSVLIYLCLLVILLDSNKSLKALLACGKMYERVLCRSDLVL